MQLALNWGTPIWSTGYTLKFLEKVTLALKQENQSRPTSSTKSTHHHQHHHLHKTANVKHLNGQYIKIESLQKVSLSAHLHFIKNLNISTRSRVNKQAFKNPSDTHFVKNVY